MIYHSLTLQGPERSVENQVTLRMLMNDKIMFDRYYCINLEQTIAKMKKTLAHYIL